MSGRHFKKSAGYGRHSSRGDRTLFIIVAVAMVLGTLFIAYPIVSNWLSKIEREKVEQTHEEAIKKTSKRDLSKYRKAAVEYNENLLAGKTVVTDPFDPNTLSSTASKRYWQTLNIGGDGLMATLTIPKLGISLPVYHGIENDVLQKGVGHMPTTSVPIGGPSTHAVLAGHTGLPAMVVFDRLDTLVKGDYFVIRVLGEDHAYRVTHTEVVLPSETESLAIQEGRDLVTLVTCTPYGVNDHRLLVHAERCKVPADYYKSNHGVSPVAAASSAAKDPATMFSILGAVIALLGIAFASIQLLRMRAAALRNPKMVGPFAKGLKRASRRSAQ